MMQFVVAAYQQHEMRAAQMVVLYDSAAVVISGGNHNGRLFGAPFKVRLQPFEIPPAALCAVVDKVDYSALTVRFVQEIKSHDAL